jgi:hypothetical protein
MANAKWFSKLDANQGHWQIPLDEESQLLTTLNILFGRYCYASTPFGITSVQKVCRKCSERARVNTLVISKMLKRILTASKLVHERRRKSMIDQTWWRESQAYQWTDKKGVERLLVTVNYLGKFIPNLAIFSKPTRMLLKAIEFQWSFEISYKEAFQEIKNILTKDESPVLKFFDVTKPITISLLQDGNPVAICVEVFNRNQICSVLDRFHC